MLTSQAHGSWSERSYPMQDYDRRKAQSRRRARQHRTPRPYRYPSPWVEDAKAALLYVAVMVFVCVGIWVTIYPESLTPVLEHLPFSLTASR